MALLWDVGGVHRALGRVPHLARPPLVMADGLVRRLVVVAEVGEKRQILD